MAFSHIFSMHGGKLRGSRWLSGVSAPALIGAVVALTPQAAFAQSATDTAPDQATTVAQGESADQGQDIVVTGIRAAITKALDIKRHSDSIVDAISAEDIGKLPDANIAEAVQRIPGVSIDREGGEGRHISINGLGPEFSLTLLNGRQIASSDSNRSFSFDTIASSLVSQIVVYKTINADNPEGGLGGTVDVRTTRPLDFDGFKASIQASYNYDDNSKAGFPQVSGLISDRFLDGRLGVLLSFTHQKRRNLHYQAGTGAWGVNYFIDPVGHYYVEDALGDDAWRPWNVHFEEDESNRTRDGGTAVLQFQASDRLTLTADYLYSKFTVKDRTKYGGAYLWAFICAEKNADGKCVKGTPGTVMDNDHYYTTLDMSGPVDGVPQNAGSYLWQYTSSERPTTTQMAGFNAEWNPSSRFKGIFDAYWSQAINDNRGLNTLVNLEMGHQPEYTLTMPPSGLPVLDTMGNDLGSHPQDLGISQVYNSGTYVKAVNKGAQADFDWTVFSRTHLKFGASWNEQRKSDAGYSTPQPIDQLYHATGLGQPFPSSVINGVTTVDGFPVFNVDTDALRAWMADPDNLAKRPHPDNGSFDRTLDAFNENGGWTARRNASAFTVDEKDTDAYGQIAQEFLVGGLPSSIVAGLRYSQTDLTSSGTSRIIIGYTPNTQNANNLVAVYADDGAQTPVSAKHSYHYFLPSLNVKLELTPHLIYRFALTRTMTRPSLGALAPAISCCGGTVLRRTGSGTNPALAPYTSNNVDLSAEWYYSNRGAFAVAAFYKDAQNFIVNLTEPEQVTTITSVDPGILKNGQPMSLSELQTSYISRPRNAASANVSGITAAWTHSFAFGLGFQANYTKVWSHTRTEAPDAPTFAMPGVSDTANAILFYEKGPISARVAYNWRSAYLVSPADSFNRAVYGDDHYQVDARIGVDLGHDLEVGVSVVNLTNSKNRYYSQKKQYFEALDDYGRQYSFTVSKKF